MPVEKIANTADSLKRKLTRKRLLLIAAAVFITIGLIVGIYWVFIGRFYESTDDAYVAGNLVQVMPQVTGHVTKILADETDFVTKNEPLVMIDKADATVTLQKAESQLAITVRQVNQLYQNMAQLQSNVTVAEDNLEIAKEAYERRKQLTVNKTISSEDFRNSKLNYDRAIAALALTKHQLSASVDVIGTTDLYHHPQVQQAIINLQNAYLNWRRTTILAPNSGYIAKRQVQVGQQVSPETVLMIITPIDQIWVNANFKETQLENIRIGQPAKLSTDIYGGSITYDGTVVGISTGAGDVFDLLPPQNATGNWIKVVQRLPVRILINPEQLQKYPLRLGLSVTATVNTSDRSGQVLTTLPRTKTIYQARDDIDDIKQANQLIDKILKDNAVNIIYTPPKQSSN